MEHYYRQHLEALRENNYRKRVKAQWGLIARGTDSLPYLSLMLRSRNSDSREDAAGALEWLGERGFVAELLTALDRETDRQARDSIVLTLGTLGDRAAIPALAALLRAPETDGDTRHCTAESLGTIVHGHFDDQDDPIAAALTWLDEHGGSA